MRGKALPRVAWPPVKEPHWNPGRMTGSRFCCPDGGLAKSMNCGGKEHGL